MVSTPIGNLEDITLRAIRILGEVDLIAAEDTRKSGRLLKHIQLHKPIVSYHEHNKKLRQEFILGELAQGKNIALICDAGTPSLSDPGIELVKAVIDEQFEVVSIPGPSAFLTALLVSGLNKGTFCFEGFLPKTKVARIKALKLLVEEKRVMIFYEAPHRLIKTFEDMVEIFGKTRQIAVCRELTKRFEEVQRGSLEEMIIHFNKQEPRGEFTLVLAGAKTNKFLVDWQKIKEDFNKQLATGVSRKKIAKELAKHYHVKSNDIYKIGLKKENT